MEDLWADFLQSIEYDPAEWDNEFYVSISKASDLSGLSQSQIRYFEALKGVNIGKREGPNARNRVYTKRDIQLLRWVYRNNAARPAELANTLSEHQAEIFERLGQAILPQLVKRECKIAGYDAVISDLATLLMEIWQGSVSSGQAILYGAILGPGNKDWQKAFKDNLNDKSRNMIDLKGCLVIWPTPPESKPSAEYFVFFSSQSWYHPLTGGQSFDTCWFSETEQALSVVFVWQQATESASSTEQIEDYSLALDTSKKILTKMLIESLCRVLNHYSAVPGQSISVFSRSTMGPSEVTHRFSLLLNHCIKPYFPNCYLYIASFGEREEVEILEEAGDLEAGYIYPFLSENRVLDAHKIPWWIRWAREQVVIALDRDVKRRHESREESGSAVCIPLVRQDRVIGLVGIENPETSKDAHCLATRNGIDGPALLRFLICMAEVVADYLDLSASSAERVERTQIAYSSEETSKWHMSLYDQGGPDYSEVIEKILDWTYQIGMKPEDRLDVVIFDIAQDDMLARDYKGFDIITKIVQSTYKRIKTAIERDPKLSSRLDEKQLILFEESVADHLVLATIRTPLNYLLVSLERLRKLWDAPNDTFTWEGKKVDVSLQVGVCKFSDLSSYERDIASELMKHHLWTIGEKFKQEHKQIIEYDAIVPTEKI
ncbi:MAG: MerR family transcriptional regulator [Ktedonobacteraceae bacterium]